MMLSSDFTFTLILLFSIWLLKMKFFKNLVFGFWLNFLNFSLKRVKKDNRWFKKWDETLWGCDNFNEFKAFENDFIEVLDGKRSEDLIINNLEMEYIKCKKYKIALKIASECKRENYVHDLIVFLERAVCSYKIERTKVKMSVIGFSGDDYILEFQLILLSMSSSSKKDDLAENMLELTPLKKIMNLQEIIKIQILFKEMEENCVPVVERSGDSYVGLNFEDLITNCMMKTLIRSKNKTKLRLHGSDHTIINFSNYRIEDRAMSYKKKFEEWKSITEELNKTGVNESVFKNKSEKLIKRMQFKNDPIDWGKVMLKINFMLSMLALELIYFIKSVNGKVLDKGLLFPLLIIMSIGVLNNFKVKFILSKFKFSNVYFWLAYKFLGESYAFCGINQIVPVKIKKYAFLKSSYPVKWGEISSRVKIPEQFNLNEEFYYVFKKVSLYLTFNGSEVLVIKVKNGEEKMQLIEMSINQFNKLKTVLDLIKNCEISGLSVYETKIFNQKIIHLAEFEEIVHLIKSKESDIYICEIREGVEVVSGVQVVEMGIEELEICKLNGWRNMEALAAMKHYCTLFWGEENTNEASSYLNLPCKRQTLNKEWFPTITNKKLKIFLSGASSVLYYCTGMSYYKVESVKNNLARDKVKNLLPQKYELKVIKDEVSKKSNIGFEIEFTLKNVDNDPKRPEDGKTGSVKMSRADEENEKAILLYERIKTNIKEFKENEYREHENYSGSKKLILRETEKGGFEGWLSRNKVVLQGNSKERRRKKDEEYAKWILSPDYAKEKENPPKDGYLHFRRNRDEIIAMASNVFTCNGEIRDIRLDNDGFANGNVTVMKNKKKINLINYLESKDGTDGNEVLDQIGLCNLKIEAKFKDLCEEGVLANTTEKMEEEEGEKEEGVGGDEVENKFSVKITLKEIKSLEKDFNEKMFKKLKGLGKRGKKKNRGNRNGLLKKTKTPIKVVFEMMGKKYVKKFNKTKQENWENPPILTKNSLGVFTKSEFIKMATVRLGKMFLNNEKFSTMKESFLEKGRREREKKLKAPVDDGNGIKKMSRNELLNKFKQMNDEIKEMNRVLCNV